MRQDHRSIWMGQVRHVANSLGAFLATTGYIGENDIETVAGFIVLVLASYSSYLDKKERNDS